MAITRMRDSCAKSICLSSRCKEGGRGKKDRRGWREMILFDKRKVTATLRLTHLPDRAIRGTTGFEASE